MFSLKVKMYNIWFFTPIKYFGMSNNLLGSIFFSKYYNDRLSKTNVNAIIEMHSSESSIYYITMSKIESIV